MAFKYDYIKEGASVEWQRRVDEIRQRDNYTCRLCGAQDKQVQVHHTWYNQNLHYWEHPDEQLVTLCKDCHSKETDLVRRFKNIKSTLDANIVSSIESMMKRGILLSSFLDVFKQMEADGIKTPCVAKTNTNQPYLPTSPNIEEKMQLFLKVLRPLETKYNKDYIQTFIEYWLTEKSGKFRFEIDENGNTMNAFGITPEYMKLKLENWNSKYNIIVQERQSNLILDEIDRKYEFINKEYEDENIKLRCREINHRKISEGVYVSSDRLHGKVLYDNGIFVKSHYEFDNFLQKKKKISLCCPIEGIEEEENSDYSVFCLLYEANQALKKIKEHNRTILSSIDSQITYKSFCDNYGIKYGSKTKNDKTIKEKIESMKCPLKIEYFYGDINILLQRTSNQDFLLKLNDVFGFQFFVPKHSQTISIQVPYKVLYLMDGLQFDFRDDSFENGTMKSIKLPTEYKHAQFYIDKIEEMLNRN